MLVAEQGCDRIKGHAMDEPHLDHLELLSVLTSEQRADLVKQCRWRRYANQEQILDRSSGSTDTWFVAAGSLRVVIHSLVGREISELTRGDLLKRNGSTMNILDHKQLTRMVEDVRGK